MPEGTKNDADQVGKTEIVAFLFSKRGGNQIAAAGGPRNRRRRQVQNCNMCLLLKFSYARIAIIFRVKHTFSYLYKKPIIY